MKKIQFITLICVIAMMLSACNKKVISYLDHWLVESSQYETTNIEDYGHFTGNYDNETVNKFVTSFFPKEIESSFENVKYVYRAEKFDTYAFEAWLEFEVQDENAFQQHINYATKGEELQVFQYDNAYLEYIIADSFQLVSPHEDDIVSDRNFISYAMIGKILINDAENKIIYVALGVYDGGGVNTDFLREYFTRFDIDPLQYDQGLESEFYIFPDER